MSYTPSYYIQHNALKLHSCTQLALGEVDTSNDKHIVHNDVQTDTAVPRTYTNARIALVYIDCRRMSKLYYQFGLRWAHSGSLQMKTIGIALARLKTCKAKSFVEGDSLSTHLYRWDV